MNLQLFIENFPWRRFGTPYETNANIVKQSVLKIIDGTASFISDHEIKITSPE